MVARGAEPLRKDALDALRRGRPWQARDLAFSMLAEVPESPLALVVWADAAEAMFLEDEAREALLSLSRRLPYRADVWLRLAELESRAGLDASVSLQRALQAAEPAEAASIAALRLLERALDAEDEPAVLALTSRLEPEAQSSSTLRFRLAEAALLLGDRDEAYTLVEAGEAPELTDARGWLTLARASIEHDGAVVVQALKRALILGGAREHDRIAELLSQPPRAGWIRELLPLVEALNVSGSAEWRIARGLAEGDIEPALAWLEAHARAASTERVRLRWLEAALLARQANALARACDAMAAACDPLDGANAGDALALLAALASSDRERLAHLDGVRALGSGWAAALREDVYASWLVPGREDGWALIAAEAETLASGWLDPEALTQLVAWQLDFERPLRVAVVGEFNAGKSSLINSILGEAVVPVGILPTTATVNRLRWAPERFVRVEFRDFESAPRVFAYGMLGKALKDLDATSVQSVSIFAPLEQLRRLEIVDTPGFNADDPKPQATALAAAEDAHVLLWLVDATSALKASEWRILQRVRGAGVAMCVVVNKKDRVAPAELPGLMKHVEDGLDVLGVSPFWPLFPFSAKQAREGHEKGSRSRGARLVDEGAVGPGAELEGTCAPAAHVATFGPSLRAGQPGDCRLREAIGRGHRSVPVATSARSAGLGSRMGEGARVHRVGTETRVHFRVRGRRGLVSLPERTCEPTRRGTTFRPCFERYYQSRAIRGPGAQTARPPRGAGARSQPVGHGPVR